MLARGEFSARQMLWTMINVSRPPTSFIPLVQEADSAAGLLWVRLIPELSRSVSANGEAVQFYLLGLVSSETAVRDPEDKRLMLISVGQ